MAIVGEAALSEEDRRYLSLAERFEYEFINQGSNKRPLEETFAQAWKLLRMLPPRELKRINPEFIEQYHRSPDRAAKGIGMEPLLNNNGTG